MHSVNFRRKSNKQVRWPVLLALSAASLGLASVAASATAGRSFIYCLNHGGAKIFAGREEANGNLLFGISVWSPAGQNISVFGVAIRHGSGWQYSENMHAPLVSERCQLDITRSSDGTLRITADRNANCQSHGGVNAEIGAVRFPRSAYEGAVTTELDDPEAFQRAGKCAGKRN